MARPRKEEPQDSPAPKRRPAATPDARENQLIARAVDLAEKQLIEGTASAQVITHYLRLGTSRERLEQEKLRQETGLLIKRAEDMASSARVEELMGKALDAFRSYSGQPPVDSEDDGDY